MKIARPWYELMSGENAKKKRQNIEWTDRCQQSFVELKQCCSQCPVLAYANYMQGLLIPFACVGSGDPVRVLCLYTTNTLDTL